MSQSQSQMHQHQKISLKCWRSWFWHFSAYIICHMVFDRILLVKSFELYRAYTLVCCLCFRLIRITPLVVIGVECPLQYPSFIPGDTSFMQRYQSKGAWIGNRHGQDCHGGGWWWCWVYRWCWCWYYPGWDTCHPSRCSWWSFAIWSHVLRRPWSNNCQTINPCFLGLLCGWKSWFVFTCAKHKEELSQNCSYLGQNYIWNTHPYYIALHIYIYIYILYLN